MLGQFLLQLETEDAMFKFDYEQGDIAQLIAETEFIKASLKVYAGLQAAASRLRIIQTDQKARNKLGTLVPNFLRHTFGSGVSEGKERYLEIRAWEYDCIKFFALFYDRHTLQKLSDVEFGILGKNMKSFIFHHHLSQLLEHPGLYGFFTKGEEKYISEPLYVNFKNAHTAARIRSLERDVHMDNSKENNSKEEQKGPTVITLGKKKKGDVFKLTPDAVMHVFRNFPYGAIKQDGWYTAPKGDLAGFLTIWPNDGVCQWIKSCGTAIEILSCGDDKHMKDSDLKAGNAELGCAEGIVVSKDLGVQGTAEGQDIMPV